jgi:phosphatidylinositol alpha-1,6-mannosyltransferase
MCGLADALAASGRDVTVFADCHGDGAEADFDRDRAYPVLRFSGLKPWRRWRKARAFATLARGDRIDATFTDSWKSAGRIAGAAKDAGVPLVCLAHGDDVTATDDKRRRRVRRTLGLVTRIAAISAATAARVAALGIPRDRIAVVNPGVTLPAEPSEEARDRIARRLGAGRPLLTTVARLKPRKGHDRVITALPALLRDHPETVYAIAGAGPHRNALERLARETGVTNQVAFLGRVSDDDMVALLDAADLFVMPAREEVSAGAVEGFGIAYIEAAFRSLPAVAGRSGGVADAVREGITGLLCNGDDPNDVERVIREAIADPQRLARLGAAARETAEREFAWPIAVERYLACIA